MRYLAASFCISLMVGPSGTGSVSSYQRVFCVQHVAVLNQSAADNSGHRATSRDKKRLQYTAEWRTTPPPIGIYSERSASAGSTLAARAAGRAEAITAAASITAADASNVNAPGNLSSAKC